MDHRRITIRSIQDAESLHAQIIESASRTAAWLRSYSDEPMALLKKLKFELVGHDPITGESLNVVEQLNQTFTILATLRAVEELIRLHPDSEGFQLCLGTSSGRDISSVKPDFVAAEVFAATHPRSNQKLKMEIDRLAKDHSQHRYVFFASPRYSPGRHEKLERLGTDIRVYATDAL
jgi:hypothetical protein